MRGQRSELDLKPHGTVAAARRHRRRGERLCESCRQAETLKVAEWRERTGYEAARRDRYRAARDAGLGSYDAQAARSNRRFEQDLAGRS